MQQAVERLPFDLKNRVRHSAAVLKSIERIDHELGEYAAGTMLGGILRNGQMSYVAVGPLLEVMTSRTGARVSSCNFDCLFHCTTHITCITELPLPSLNACLLAVGLDSARHGGLVCLLAVHGAQLLRTIELADKITSSSFIGDRVQCRRLGALRTFDGCLAVGTGSGTVLLLDLRLRQCVDMLFGRRAAGAASAADASVCNGGGSAANGSNNGASNSADNRDCLIVCASVTPDELRREQRAAAAERISFAVQLQPLDGAGAVLATLTLRPLQALAVGLSDGRMVLYSLRAGSQFEAFHLAHPAAVDSPLLRLAMCEPADDPRACVYLWAFHVHAETSMAVMHCAMYDAKRRVRGGVGIEDDEDGGDIAADEEDEEDGCDEDAATAVYTVFEGFQSCSVRLSVPIFDREAYPIACQSVRRTLQRSGAEDDEEADTTTLCVLAWTSGKSTAARAATAAAHSDAEAATMVCVFDLNQWYKEQMPHSCDWRRAGNTFLAVFAADVGSTTVLDVWIDVSTVMPFASLQRPEEHFRPEALNLECIAFTGSESCRLHWAGLQNQSLELLVQNGPIALIQPIHFFNTMVRATLIPQFTDYNPLTTPTISYMQHFLLSIALEYNCASLLRDCALTWADGSHLGADPRRNGGGLSLSTLTDWLWKRAGDTKTHCNQLCVPLFDHSGITLDARSRQQLLNYTRQLRTLADLMGTVLSRCRRFIPDAILGGLESQRNAIRMAFEYQEVLQWLLNIGLLPEGTENGDKSSDVPYPYAALREFYHAQRHKYWSADATLLNAKHSCRVMYIDAFIEHQCNPACLRAEWRQTGVEKDAMAGLYPPSSLQAMLRTLLVPGVAAEIKYTLFVYLFLDLNVALSDERYATVGQRLIKFPAVFGLNPALIKTTQAFWNLDHGQPETAIEELISPLSQERHLQRWQQETLIESLLVQGAAHLALRALRAPRPPISALLEMRALLANNLVSEAFQLQRARADPQLLGELFRTCHAQQQWQLVLDLALTGAEESHLGEFLRTCDSALTENLHFVFLLQRGKYMDAIMFVDDLQHNRRTVSGDTTSARRKAVAKDLETASTILAAYKLTLTPATRSMANMYYSMRDHINAKLNDQAPKAANRQTQKAPSEPAHPNPLSSKLLQHKLSMLGGVYQRSLLSAEHTSPSYWFNRSQRMCALNADAVPFLRNPQCDIVGLAQRQLLVHAVHGGQLSYAVDYVGSQKRSARAEDGLAAESLQPDQQRGTSDEHAAPQKRRRIDDVSTMDAYDFTDNGFETSTLTTAAATAAAAAAAAAAATAASTSKAMGKSSRMVGVQSESLLGTPVVGAASNLSVRSTRNVATPQSILKARATAAVNVDEKSIRFELPDDSLVLETETAASSNTTGDSNDSHESSVAATSDNWECAMEASDGAQDEQVDIPAAAPFATSTSLSQFVDAAAAAVAEQISEHAWPSDALTIDVPEISAPDNKASTEICTTDEPTTDVDLSSPPACQTAKPVHSQQPSPLQRRIQLGEGPMPRKRLHSSVAPQASTGVPTLDSPAPGDAPQAVVLAVPAARKYKTPTKRANIHDVASAEQQPTPPMPTRRSSRNRSVPPETSAVSSDTNTTAAEPAAAAAATSTSARATPQLSRQPLSRMVLLANAQKAIASNASANDREMPADDVATGENTANSSTRSATDLNESAMTTCSEMSSMSVAYLTDDSQHFLDFWRAKQMRQPSLSGRQMSVSQSESDFAEMHTLSDSDASFVCNVTQPEDEPAGDRLVEDPERNAIAGDQQEDDNVFEATTHEADAVPEDVQLSNENDDELDQVDNEAVKKPADEELTIISSTDTSTNDTVDDDDDGECVSESESIINISSGSNSSSLSNDSDSSDDDDNAADAEAVADVRPSDDGAHTTETPQRQRSTSFSTDDGNTNGRFQTVSAVVHSEHAALDVDEKSASSDSGDTSTNKYHSASSASALLYGDLEAIMPADEQHDADDVLNEAVTSIGGEQSTTTVETTTVAENESADAERSSHDHLNNAQLLESYTTTRMDLTSHEQTASHEHLNNAQLLESSTSVRLDADEDPTIHVGATTRVAEDEIDLNNAQLLESSTSIRMDVEEYTFQVETLNRGIIDESNVSTTQVDRVTELAVKANDNTDDKHIIQPTLTPTAAVTAGTEDVEMANNTPTTELEPVIDEKVSAGVVAEETVNTDEAAAKDDQIQKPPSTEPQQTDLAGTSPLVTHFETVAVNVDNSVVPTESHSTENNAAAAEIQTSTPLNIETPTDMPQTPNATNTRRSLRLRSNSQLDTPTPTTPTRTPASTRKQRGQSEPKTHAISGSDALRRAASVRRMLEESHADAVASPQTAATAAALSTPTRRTRRQSKDEASSPAVVETPTRRLTRRRASQNASPAVELETATDDATMTAAAAAPSTPKRNAKMRASSQIPSSPPDADDNVSVVSHSSAVSRQSTRTTRSTRSMAQKRDEQKDDAPNSQATETHEDDDFDDSASQKSSKSTQTTATKRMRAAAKILPAIVEVEKSPSKDDESGGTSAMPTTPTTEYSSESRRLTRHQIAIMERMKTVQHEATSRIAGQSTRTRRAASVTSSPDEGKIVENNDNDSDHENEDDEVQSVKSGTSRRSNRSLRSRRGTKTIETVVKTVESIKALGDIPELETSEQPEELDEAAEGGSSKPIVRQTRKTAAKK